MKKVISIALALLMVAVMLPVMAMAADTLPDPVNGIITLTKSYMVKDETVVLDLKGNTITGNSIFVCDGGSLTIKNGTVNTTIMVYGGEDKTTKLSIESDVVITTAFGIRLEGGVNGNRDEFASNPDVYKTNTGTYGKSEINFAGTINCTDAGIWLYGNIGHSDAVKDKIDPSHNVVNIKNGAKINVTGSGSDGIGLMGCVTVNVEEGASISAGEAAVFVKAGTLNVSGGTLTATDNGPADSILANGNGAEAGVAAAVAVTGTYNKFHPITVNINGGTFTNVNGNAVFVGHSVSGNAAVPYTKGVDVNITGGNFVSAPGKQAVLIQNSVDGDASSYADNRANAVAGGTFSSDVTPYVGQNILVVTDENNNYYVGNTARDTVQNATGGTFTVVRAVPDEGVEFEKVNPGVTVKNGTGEKVTVNGNDVPNGGSYTVPGAPIIIYTPDNEPAFLSGANQVVAPGAAATFRIDEEYDRLLAVAVDGVTLDKSNYEAWSGSTYIKLLPKFMKTLSVGTHTLTAYFTSHTVSTTFTISEGAKNPATGANDFVGVAAAMAVVSLLGAAAVIRKK